MNKNLESFDRKSISLFRHYGDEVARVALFIIFFWFGILKVFGISPAGPLVMDLLNVTFLGFIDPEVFVVWFGAFEALLGIMVLIPRFERITFALLGFHLFTTIMPLYLLPGHTWDAWFAPSLIGQYIIKNTALVSLGILLFARMQPMSRTHTIWAREDEKMSQ